VVKIIDDSGEIIHPDLKTLQTVQTIASLPVRIKVDKKTGGKKTTLLATTEKRRIHPPPPPSTPLEAPWREVEEIIELLRLVSIKLDAVISTFVGVIPPAAVPSAITFDGRLDALVGMASEIRDALARGLAPGAPITLDGRLDALVKFTRMPLEWGTATGGSKNKLICLGKSWANDVWAEYELAIVEGVGAGQVRRIEGNDRTSITPQSDFDINPDNTSVFVIRARSDIVKWGGTTLTGRDISLDLANLDIALSVLAKHERWGRNVSPEWTHAAAQTAPGAGTALVTQAVTAGKSGYIYGFFISSQEANDFLLNWTSGSAAKSKRIIFGGSGTVENVDGIAMNEGLPADAGSNITITNVNAGGAGKVYQANLLYGEV